MEEKEAIFLLKKYAGDEESYQAVLKHSKIVQKVALKLAKKAGADIETVGIGSLLHDIGRFDYPPKTNKSILHGITGGEILRNEGLPVYAEIAENHLGIGISKDEIIRQKLPLPLKDYLPKTREEIIICYADNLVHGNKVYDEKFVEDRFAKQFGEDYRRKVQRFHQKVHRLIGISS